jgi:hypothetical protein
MKIILNAHRFMCLDTSTKSAAFAVMDCGKLEQYGIINFNGSNIYQKVADISRKFGGLVEKIGVDTVVIESTFFAQNPKTSTNLALAQGAILGAACSGGVNKIGGVVPIVWQRGIGNPPLTRIEKEDLVRQFPDKTKSWYKNKPRAVRKQRTIDIINKRFDISVTDDNIADACGIGLFVLENEGKIQWQ